MTLRGLIFDVDGTLADTEEMHRQAFNAAFAAEHLPWCWGHDTYRELLKVAGGRERIMHFVDAVDISAREKSQLRTRVVAIHANKTRLYARFVAVGRATLRQGVAALLQEARDADLKLAIATTTSRPNVEALLRCTLGQSALTWFATIATGETGVPKKPAPDIYVHVLDQLGVLCSEAIAFEDSANGVEAAKRTGLFTVVTPTAWTEHENLAEADLILANLGNGGSLAALSELHAQWLVRRREAA